MKTLLLANGVSVHTVRWANSLVDQGIEVHLATQDGCSEDLSRRVHKHRLPRRGVLGYFTNAAALRRVLEEVCPDIFHAHYASGYGTLARRTGWPYLLSIWGSDVYKFPYHSPLHRRLLAANLRSATQLCSTSKAMADHTRRLFSGLPAMRLTPFGVDLQRFRPRRPRVERPTITIGTVKGMRPVYGIDVLLKGFARCRERLLAESPEAVQRLRLRLVGEGPQRPELEALAERLGIGRVVTFAGAVPHDRVPGCLEELDIYVAMSRSESFGVAVLEASACETPVVTSDVGGLPEVVVDGQTGVLVNEGDVETLAEMLSQLVVDPDRRRQMGRLGRRFVEREYAWEACVRKMIHVYEQLMDLQASRAA